MEIKQRVNIFVGSLLATLIALRIFLTFSPTTNFNFLGYNIHHLFIGAFLIVVLLIFFIFGIVNNFIIILSGVSSALVLDEIVYLIATDGSDITYLSTVSLYGAIVLASIILLIALILYKTSKQKVRQ